MKKVVVTGCLAQRYSEELAGAAGWAPFSLQDFGALSVRVLGAALGSMEPCALAGAVKGDWQVQCQLGGAGRWARDSYSPAGRVWPEEEDSMQSS